MIGLIVVGVVSMFVGAAGFFYCMLSNKLGPAFVAVGCFALGLIFIVVGATLESDERYRRCQKANPAIEVDIVDGRCVQVLDY